MIVVAGLGLGVFLGVRAARRRNGDRLDIIQHAAGYGMACALIGVILTLLIDRLAG